ncbi:Germanicol synthase [Vitis vinifera]|uniref:Germanicol synthase n=1 Tax=Vitis vinifera TaxID=29760 RepID=A0A438J478_VITVI|nr:Germanicol synthase [Vitis vinifera]
MRTASSQQWDTSLAIQVLIACNLTDEIGATLMKGHDFIKKSQVRDNPYGDFRSMYKHISMGSWTFSDRDHGWQVSDYTTESLKVTNFCSNTSYTCGMVFHLTLISVTIVKMVVYQPWSLHELPNGWSMRPYKTVAAMWNYLHTVYNQDNSTRCFQLEYEMVHATSKQDQFLMKLQPDFEIARFNLMNGHPIPSLDACLSELLHEDQCIVTQATMEHRSNCFSCKDFGHIARDCPKKSCNYCKKQGHIISVCPIRSERKHNTNYHVSIGASSSAALPAASLIVPIPTPTTLANPNTLTPEMVQQSIIYVFSAFGLSSNHTISSKPWYFESEASNHMKNTVLSNVRNYDGNLKINTTDGSSLPISAVGDLSSSLTDVFVSPDLSTNLLSVGQLVDNNCNVNFSRFGCVVQDQMFGKIIAKGPKVG